MLKQLAVTDCHCSWHCQKDQTARGTRDMRQPEVANIFVMIR